ncbi:hypothetical protein cypCar_00016041 [Cyprinus carpio]|nr:hypothetical protein cypCar_00016041 [Cyprinus carpio]
MPRNEETFATEDAKTFKLVALEHGCWFPGDPGRVKLSLMLIELISAHLLLISLNSMASTSQILEFKLSPPSQDGSPERLFSCDEDIERRYEVVPSVVCSMCCLFGIIYCFFGRLRRMNEYI